MFLYIFITLFGLEVKPLLISAVDMSTYRSITVSERFDLSKHYNVFLAVSITKISVRFAHFAMVIQMPILSEKEQNKNNACLIFSV